MRTAVCLVCVCLDACWKLDCDRSLAGLAARGSGWLAGKGARIRDQGACGCVWVGGWVGRWEGGRRRDAGLWRSLGCLLRWCRTAWVPGCLPVKARLGSRSRGRTYALTQVKAARLPGRSCSACSRVQHRAQS